MQLTSHGAVEDREAEHEQTRAKSERERELSRFDRNWGLVKCHRAGNPRIGKNRKAIPKHAMPPMQHAMKPRKLRISMWVSSSD